MFSHEDPQPMKHAPFAPSAAERWIACPASHLRTLSAPPGVESEYAARGTLMHDIAADMINAGGVTKRHGELEEDEWRAVQLYVAYALGLCKGSIFAAVELKLTHSAELFGTSDLVVLEKDGTLNVVDYKGGAGVAVDANDNAQALTYAMMALAQITAAMRAKVKRVRITIVQPRLEGVEPIRHAVVTVEALTFWRGHVERAMVAAKDPAAKYSAGEHCRFCPVKPVCPELMRAAAVPTIANTDMTAQQVGELLLRAQLAEEWIAGLRQFAQSAIEQGHPIPGWKLVPKRANRKWDDEAKVIKLCRELKLDAYEEKVSSPAQMEKKCKGKTLPAKLQARVTQESSGVNLVRDPNPPAGEAHASITEAYNRLKFFV